MHSHPSPSTPAGFNPLLGIADPRTDQRLGFVGGIRGTRELERIVNTGEAAVAFSDTGWVE